MTTSPQQAVLAQGAASARPAVTVGLPVYNGARYVERAVRSVLVQTFGDLELVVSDNASTDATPEILRRLADADPRVRVVRAGSNRGAAANYNRTLELARGGMFCWIAHDDWFAPTYLEQCVTVLRSYPDTVLAHARMAVVDGTGDVFREHREALPGATDPHARKRFHHVVWSLRDPTGPVFGLMRTDAVRSAGGIPATPEPDRHLLYCLSLAGAFRELEAPLFYHYGPRGHSTHYGVGAARRRSWEWLHPGNHGKPMLKPVRIVLAQVRAIGCTELPIVDKVLCVLDVIAAAACRRTASRLRKVGRSRRRRVSKR